MSLATSAYTIGFRATVSPWSAQFPSGIKYNSPPSDPHSSRFFHETLLCVVPRPSVLGSFFTLARRVIWLSRVCNACYQNSCQVPTLCANTFPALMVLWKIRYSLHLHLAISHLRGLCCSLFFFASSDLAPESTHLFAKAPGNAYCDSSLRSPTALRLYVG